MNIKGKKEAKKRLKFPARKHPAAFLVVTIHGPFALLLHGQPGKVTGMNSGKCLFFLPGDIQSIFKIGAAQPLWG